MVDPVNEYIEVYTLKEGKFEQVGVYGTGESIPSPLLGNMELKDIFERWNAEMK